MSKPPAEMVDPKSLGARRLQLKAPVFDEAAMARVDSALESMSDSFQQWLAEEIDRLQAARRDAQGAQYTSESLTTLASAAHDLKGAAGMYGYPLITQIAASLYRLADSEQARSGAQGARTLIDAHVDAIRVAARDQIKTDAHPVGRQVLLQLKASVDALGVAQE